MGVLRRKRKREKASEAGPVPPAEVEYSWLGVQGLLDSGWEREANQRRGARLKDWGPSCQVCCRGLDGLPGKGGERVAGRARACMAGSWECRLLLRHSVQWMSCLSIFQATLSIRESAALTINLRGASQLRLRLLPGRSDFSFPFPLLFLGQAQPASKADSLS